MKTDAYRNIAKRCKAVNVQKLPKHFQWIIERNREANRVLLACTVAQVWGLTDAKD